MLFNLLAEEGGKGFNLQTLIPIIIIFIITQNKMIDGIASTGLKG